MGRAPVADEALGRPLAGVGWLTERVDLLLAPTSDLVFLDAGTLPAFSTAHDAPLLLTATKLPPASSSELE